MIEKLYLSVLQSKIVKLQTIDFDLVLHTLDDAGLLINNNNQIVKYNPLDGVFFSINQQKGKHMNGMYQRDHKIAFENAKAKGLNNPNEYMYMYSKDSKDYFKNIMIEVI